MSIMSFKSASRHLYDAGYYPESLCLACIAIDAISQKKYSNITKVGQRYQQYLVDNFRVICEIGLPGISASHISFKCGNRFPGLFPNEEGYVTVEQILYYSIRCGLVHTCEVEKYIFFCDRTHIGNDCDKLYIPKTVIRGLWNSIEQNIENFN